MGLKIMMGKDGNPRPTWYGQIMRHGKWHKTNLNVPIAGAIPRDDAGNVKLSGTGDGAFERSRRAAQRAFDAWREETKHDATEIARKAFKVVTGEDMRGVPLCNLAERWLSIKRQRKNTRQWSGTITGWFKEFETFARDFASARGRRCEYINDVTADIATAWYEKLYANFAWETVKKKMMLLRGAYNRFATGNGKNPFDDDIIMRNGDVQSASGNTPNGCVHHKPLTAAELERLFEITRNEDIYPLIVTAACTGMRIGDVCNLKWADVDLRGGFIDVVTAKKGTRATIPLFGRLREVLADRAAVPGDGGKPSAFVFPDFARMYNAHERRDVEGRVIRDENGKVATTTNRDTIYRMAQPYFARAVFGDAPDDVQDVTVDADGTADAEPRALADVIDDERFTEEKRTRMLKVYELFKAGAKQRDIAAQLNVSRALISTDLRCIERLTGESLSQKREMARRAKHHDRVELVERTRMKRGVGAHKASVYGWHSLRSTFIVLANDAGVPMADVQLVVGHKTVEQTLDYFRPERKHAAERMRMQMNGTVLDGDGGGDAANANALAVAPAAAPSMDALIAKMSKRQKKELMQKLTASM